MVRFKGGHAQPRHYYYKEAGEERLVEMLEGKYKKHQKDSERSRLDVLCQDLESIAQNINCSISKIKASLEAFKQFLKKEEQRV